MTYDTTGYRERWTVPCTDPFGQDRQLVIAPTDDHTALLVAMPADTIRLNAEQAMEMAADLLKAVLRILPADQETETTTS